MPVTAGGGSKAPKKAPKPKPAPVVGPPTLADIPKKEQIGGAANPSKQNQQGVVVPKATSSPGYKKNFTNEKSYTKGGTIKQAAAKRLGLSYKGASVKPGSRKTGGPGGLGSPTPSSARKRRPGGTATPGGGGGGGGGGIRRTGGGQNEGIRGGLNDPNLVGSSNAIDEFGGDQYGGGGTEFDGGGGGSGSSLFGRESVSQVGELDGQSMEEVVYGVKKRGRKVARPRGE